MADLQRKCSVSEKLRRLHHFYRCRYPSLFQFAQFCAVGVSGTVVDLAIVHLIYHEVDHSMPAARFAGIGVAMTWNFLLNRHLTFREARGAAILPQYARFVAACSVGAALNWLVSIGLFLHGPWFAGRVARCALAGIAVATGSNFLLSKYFAFRHRRHPSEPLTVGGTAASAPLRSPSV